MVTLYDYQQDLLERSQAALAPEGARVMTQLPTGGGKTEIAGALLKDFLRDGRKAVWLTHREELAIQTEGRLSSKWSVSAMSGTDSWSPRRPAPRIVNGVVILKAQTVSRRNKDSTVVWNNYGPDDLLVIDEAHHAPATGWERAIKQWPGKVWGLTATPWRLSLREGFDHLFHNLVTGPQTAEMQAYGYLADSRVFAPKPGDRILGGEVGTTLDYTEGGIARANDDDGDGGRFIMTTLAVNFWRNHAAGRQTVAYAVSKGHADNLVREFEGRGIAAAAILSDTPADERGKTIADFQNGSLTVLVNVAVATEGFDLPEASCVMITRPTKSLALYLQMVGRGLRRKKGNVSDCLILDLAGNAEEHGLPEDYREWSLAARGAPAPGEAPVHYCHNCHREAHPAHHKCPECGADLGKPCLRCGKFRPWSRWAKESDCPIPHDPVCDYCHEDVHSAIGVARHGGQENYQSYWDRAYELREEGDLEAALSNLYLAIHLAKRDHELSFRSSWVVSLYIDRACMNFEAGNVKFAEDDFKTVENLFDLDENYDTGDAYFMRLRRFWNLIPDLYSRNLRALGEMHQKRAEMYEELGCSDKAELDRQKSKELNDKIAARSNSNQD